MHGVSCHLILKCLCVSLHRRVRNELHVQLFINLCIALLLFYLVYIGAQYARNQETVCIIFSTFFHYAFLVVLIAILGEVIFVLLQGTWTPTKHYVILAVVISWGKSHITVVQMLYKCLQHNVICVMVLILFLLQFLSVSLYYIYSATSLYSGVLCGSSSSFILQ